MAMLISWLPVLLRHMTWVLEMFILSRHLCSQLVRCLSCCAKLVSAIEILTCLVQPTMSSAHEILLCMMDVSSLVKAIKRRGAITEPCGTPMLVVTHSLTWLFTRFLDLLLKFVNYNYQCIVKGAPEKPIFVKSPHVEGRPPNQSA